MLRQPGRASRRAASAEVAAVRSAVASVRSGQEDRQARGHVGQGAEGHHRGQVPIGVVRVAVDVLEGVVERIGHGHELDHSTGRMVGDAGRFLEIGPAREVFLDGIGQAGQAGGNADLRHQACGLRGAEEIRVDGRGSRLHGALPRGCFHCRPGPKRRQAGFGWRLRGESRCAYARHPSYEPTASVFALRRRR